jgi:hypothetical protein
MYRLDLRRYQSDHHVPRNHGSKHRSSMITDDLWSQCNNCLCCSTWTLIHGLLSGPWCLSQSTDNTSQQDFVPRKVYCVSNVTFHTESKHAIKIFPSPTVFVQWHFLLLIFRNFNYFLQWFFSTWTNILNCFEHRLVIYSLPLSNH